MIYNRFNSIFNELDAVRYPRFTSRSDEKKLYVEGALPGYNKKDLAIEFEDEYLTIKANSETESSLVAREFDKCFKLPTTKLDTSKSEAEYLNGILKVSIPYKKDAVKKIKIN